MAHGVQGSPLVGSTRRPPQRTSMSSLVSSSRAPLLGQSRPSSEMFWNRTSPVATKRDLLDSEARLKTFIFDLLQGDPKVLEDLTKKLRESGLTLQSAVNQNKVKGKE